MSRRKLKKRPSENRNSPAAPRWRRGNTYSAGELFMAGCGALILIMILGIVITSIIGD